MVDFLDKNSILNPNQFGFRKGLSTESAIIQVINNIHNGLNKIRHTIAISWILVKHLMC